METDVFRIKGIPTWFKQTCNNKTVCIDKFRYRVWEIFIPMITIISYAGIRLSLLVIGKADLPAAPESAIKVSRFLFDESFHF